jgi:hypothetical protein
MRMSEVLKHIWMDAASKCEQRCTFITFIGLYRARYVSKTCTASLQKIADFWFLSFKCLQLLHSDWLRAGRQRGWSSSPGKVKIFLFSTSPRPAEVIPDSYPMGTGGSFSGAKAAGAWSWPLTSSYCGGQENIDLHIHFPIRLHDVVLNLLTFLC